MSGKIQTFQQEQRYIESQITKRGSESLRLDKMNLGKIGKFNLFNKQDSGFKELYGSPKSIEEDNSVSNDS